MHWLLGGYIWMSIHHLWEVYPLLSLFQFERMYILGVMAYWAVWPGKVFQLNRVYVALMLFTLVVLTSWLLSDYKEETWHDVDSYLKILVFVFLMATSVRDEQGLRHIVWMLLLGVSLYMAHSFYEYMNGRVEYRQGINRMVGVDVSTQQSNLFAAVLLTPLPFLLPCWETSRSLLVRLGLLGFLGVTVLAIALTGSRGGYVTLGVCALLLAWCSKHRRLALAGLVLATGLLTVVLPDFVIGRFLTLIDPSAGPENAQSSAMGRVAGLLAGLELWSNNLALGTGPGSFIHASRLKFQAHNMIGQLTGDLGTAGAVTFFAFLLFFWLNYRQGLRLVRQNPAWRDSFAFLVLQASNILIAIQLVYGMAGHNLYRFQWYWAAVFNVVALQCLLQKAQAASQARFLARVPYLSAPRRKARRAMAAQAA